MKRKPCPECLPVTGEPMPAPVLSQSDYENLLHDLDMRQDLSQSDREKIHTRLNELQRFSKSDGI